MTKTPASLRRFNFPTPDEFRKWLADHVAAASGSVSGLSIRAGLSQNTLAQVLKSEGDINLGTARALENLFAPVLEGVENV